MPRSDRSYSAHSDSDHDLPLPSNRTRPRARQTQAWEAAASRNWDLHEDAAGNLTTTLNNLEEASKRKRLLKDTTPLQRGIIRHTILILDLSTAMLEKDLRPTRFLVTINYVVAFIGEFFEQNPISQLGILGMRDGVAVRISEVGGNPVEHIQAVRGLRNTLEPKGNPSLQNALEMARASLYHTPSHGTREVVIVLGALLSSDPGDIYDTIRKCVRERIRVGVIGLAARMHICAEIVGRTNGGDQSGYSVAVDEVQYRELLMGVTTPPVVRASDKEMRERNKAGLLMMGFPSRVVEEKPTLCACHGKLERGGYECSRCRAKVCGLPSTCPGCDLTLILSTHLARSYHHLFPLMNWVEVSWEKAKEKGSVQCYGCMSSFPPAPGINGVAGKDTNGEHGQRKRPTAEGASESSRYECTVCERHFCIDCDVFCHEVVHNCPGCQSSTHLPGQQVEGTVNGE
ncbi:TFIIH basal transcription factor complex p47 subunit [Elsinoe australis]|uniref:General transcription and DNA repair factor IIH n=1 Tax=Elsinoe australis TaxID=40998 RepID=A0A4U7ASG1_9PEZI|nr:TFIIH basal transcription factor complex p47 subunit [Elsinoe australis]